MSRSSRIWIRIEVRLNGEMAKWDKMEKKDVVSESCDPRLDDAGR